MTSDKRVAIITGSATGMGVACAVRLAQEGFNLVVNYTKSKTQAAEVVDACIRNGAQAIMVQANVAEDQDRRNMASLALQKWGRIDALVNSAGITKLAAHNDLEALNAEDFQRIYAVNCIGPYQMARACVPSLRVSGDGAIVNISSIAAIVATGSSIAYAVVQHSFCNFPDH